MITIRDEVANDIPAREALLDRCLGERRTAKSSERLREGRLPAQGLALTAERAGELLATVRLWHVEANGVPALLLGPLAVDGKHGGKGIGSALMRAAILEAKNRGHGAILLVGDADYYERFGFFAEKARHLVMPGPFERSRFLALELVEGWLGGAAGMIVPSGRMLASAPVRKAA